MNYTRRFVLSKTEKEKLEEVLLNSSDRDFHGCGGYRINAYQIQSLLESNQVEHKKLQNEIEKLEEKSDKNDLEIMNKLDSVMIKLDANKDDGNKRAMETEKRLTSVETLMKLMSGYLKWINYSILFGVFIFIIENIGMIEYIKNMIKSIFS